MRIRFLTATPLDVRAGSGTYVGISTLGRALEKLGHSIAYETPRVKFPVFTAGRLWFNFGLKRSSEVDLTVGFDMDGFHIAAGQPHVAYLKGVIADEARFEFGFTRFTMSMQARCERLHLQRAAVAVTSSHYSATRCAELYGLPREPGVVPEMIDLADWRSFLPLHPARSEGFTVLSVGRFYRRKRIDILLRAAAILRGRIPDLHVRIVGNGLRRASLHALAHQLKLEGTVEWLGDVSRAQLAAEYNRADVFCFPSVQEGFGIVLLEAMAAGKAIVGARAGAIPEVAPHAALVEPDNAEALAAAVQELARSAERRAEMGRQGLQQVKQFDAPVVAEQFLSAARGAMQ